MLIEIANFDKVEVGFEAVKPGVYQATCTGCALKTGRPSDKNPEGWKYIGWEFTITGPEYVNRKIFENTGYAHEKALPFLKRLVVGCGADFTAKGFTTEDCLGKNVSLTIGQVINKATNRMDNTINKIAAA